MQKGAIKNFIPFPGHDKALDYGMENASTKIILAPLKDLKEVFFQRQHPKKISLVYMRNYIR